MDVHNEIHTEQSPTPLTSTKYQCTSCQISFEDGWEQRVHMKEPWHVYNIKRRIASLPAMSHDDFLDSKIKHSDIFDTKIKKRNVGRSSKSSSTGSSTEEQEEDEGEISDDDNESVQTASPFQCLFCNQDFGNDDAGFAANIEHMRATHGLYIPNPERVVDMQSFVGYLATEIRTWHECLYCGATKDSTQSIQSHMRDKGHCLLNLDREPELLEFWETSQGGDGEDEGEQEVRPNNLSATEMLFASGRVVESRHAVPSPATATTRKKSSKKRNLEAEASTLKALPSGGSEDAESGSDSSRRASPPPQQASSSGRQLARREEMGIIGISEQQRHALVLAEKKAQRSEAVARRAREWVNAKGANTQKYDQIDGKRKHGKQNHKLQPR